jgi:DNA-binding NarL/FixJ family response regulator
MSGSMKVVIADDSALVRTHMKALLSELPDVEVVAQAATGRETVATVLEEDPDLLVLDFKMPDGTGLEALRKLRRADFRGWVMVLTVHGEETVRRAFRREGADEFYDKGRAFPDLLTRIQDLTRISPLEDRTPRPSSRAEDPES